MPHNKCTKPQGDIQFNFIAKKNESVSYTYLEDKVEALQRQLEITEKVVYGKDDLLEIKQMHLTKLEQLYKSALDDNQKLESRLDGLQNELDLCKAVTTSLERNSLANDQRLEQENRKLLVKNTELEQRLIKEGNHELEHENKQLKIKNVELEQRLNNIEENHELEQELQDKNTQLIVELEQRLAEEMHKHESELRLERELMSKDQQLERKLMQEQKNQLEHKNAQLMASNTELELIKEELQQQLQLENEQLMALKMERLTEEQNHEFEQQLQHEYKKLMGKNMELEQRLIEEMHKHELHQRLERELMSKDQQLERKLIQEQNNELEQENRELMASNTELELIKEKLQAENKKFIVTNMELEKRLIQEMHQLEQELERELMSKDLEINLVQQEKHELERKNGQLMASNTKLERDLTKAQADVQKEMKLLKKQLNEEEQKHKQLIIKHQQLQENLQQAHDKCLEKIKARTHELEEQNKLLEEKLADAIKKLKRNSEKPNNSSNELRHVMQQRDLVEAELKDVRHQLASLKHEELHKVETEMANVKQTLRMFCEKFVDDIIKDSESASNKILNSIHSENMVPKSKYQELEEMCNSLMKQMDKLERKNIKTYDHGVNTDDNIKPIINKITQTEEVRDLRNYSDQNTYSQVIELQKENHQLKNEIASIKKDKDRINRELQEKLKLEASWKKAKSDYESNIAMSMQIIEGVDEMKHACKSYKEALEEAQFKLKQLHIKCDKYKTLAGENQEELKRYKSAIVKLNADNYKVIKNFSKFSIVGGGDGSLVDVMFENNRIFHIICSKYTKQLDEKDCECEDLKEELALCLEQIRCMQADIAHCDLELKEKNQQLIKQIRVTQLENVEVYSQLEELEHVKANAALFAHSNSAELVQKYQDIAKHEAEKAVRFRMEAEERYQDLLNKINAKEEENKDLKRMLNQPKRQSVRVVNYEDVDNNKILVLANENKELKRLLEELRLMETDKLLTKNPRKSMDNKLFVMAKENKELKQLLEEMRVMESDQMLSQRPRNHLEMDEKHHEMNQKIASMQKVNDKLMSQMQELKQMKDEEYEENVNKIRVSQKLHDQIEAELRFKLNEAQEGRRNGSYLEELNEKLEKHIQTLENELFNLKQRHNASKDELINLKNIYERMLNVQSTNTKIAENNEFELEKLKVRNEELQCECVNLKKVRHGEECETACNDSEDLKHLCQQLQTGYDLMQQENFRLKRLLEEECCKRANSCRCVCTQVENVQKCLRFQLPECAECPTTTTPVCVDADELIKENALLKNKVQELSRLSKNLQKQMQGGCKVDNIEALIEKLTEDNNILLYQLETYETQTNQPLEKLTEENMLLVHQIDHYEHMLGACTKCNETLKIDNERLLREFNCLKCCGGKQNETPKPQNPCLVKSESLLLSIVNGLNLDLSQSDWIDELRKQVDDTQCICDKYKKVIEKYSVYKDDYEQLLALNENLEWNNNFLKRENDLFKEQVSNLLLVSTQNVCCAPKEPILLACKRTQSVNEPIYYTTRMTQCTNNELIPQISQRTQCTNIDLIPQRHQCMKTDKVALSSKHMQYGWVNNEPLSFSNSQQTEYEIIEPTIYKETVIKEPIAQTDQTIQVANKDLVSLTSKHIKYVWANPEPITHVNTESQCYKETLAQASEETQCTTRVPNVSINYKDPITHSNNKSLCLCSNKEPHSLLCNNTGCCCGNRRYNKQPITYSNRKSVCLCANSTCNKGVIKQPIVQQIRSVIHEPIVTQTRTVINEPIVQETRTVIHEPIVQETRTVVIEPIVQETRTVIREPIVEQTITVIDEPIVQETRTVVREPIVQIVKEPGRCPCAKNMPIPLPIKHTKELIKEEKIVQKIVPKHTCPCGKKESVVRTNVQTVTVVQKPIVREETTVIQKPIVREETVTVIQEPIVREETRTVIQEPIVREETRTVIQKPVVREETVTLLKEPIVRVNKQTQCFCTNDNSELVRDLESEIKHLKRSIKGVQSGFSAYKEDTHQLEKDLMSQKVAMVEKGTYVDGIMKDVRVGQYQVNKGDPEAAALQRKLRETEAQCEALKRQLLEVQGSIKNSITHTNSYKDVNQENLKLNKSYMELLAELEKMRVICKDYEHEISQLTTMNENLFQEKTGLTQTVNNLRSNCSEYEKAIKKCMQDNQVLRSENAQLKAKNGSLGDKTVYKTGKPTQEADANPIVLTRNKKLSNENVIQQNVLMGNNASAGDKMVYRMDAPMQEGPKTSNARNKNELPPIQEGQYVTKITQNKNEVPMYQKQDGKLAANGSNARNAKNEQPPMQEGQYVTKITRTTNEVPISSIQEAQYAPKITQNKNEVPMYQKQDGKLAANGSNARNAKNELPPMQEGQYVTKITRTKTEVPLSSIQENATIITQNMNGQPIYHVQEGNIAANASNARNNPPLQEAENVQKRNKNKKLNKNEIKQQEMLKQKLLLENTRTASLEDETIYQNGAPLPPNTRYMNQQPVPPIQDGKYATILPNSQYMNMQDGKYASMPPNTQYMNMQDGKYASIPPNTQYMNMQDGKYASMPPNTQYMNMQDGKYASIPPNTQYMNQQPIPLIQDGKNTPILPNTQYMNMQDVKYSSIPPNTQYMNQQPMPLIQDGTNTSILPNTQYMNMHMQDGKYTSMPPNTQYMQDGKYSSIPINTQYMLDGKYTSTPTNSRYLHHPPLLLMPTIKETNVEATSSCFPNKKISKKKQIKLLLEQKEHQQQLFKQSVFMQNMERIRMEFELQLAKTKELNAQKNVEALELKSEENKNNKCECTSELQTTENVYEEDFYEEDEKRKSMTRKFVAKLRHCGCNPMEELKGGQKKVNFDSFSISSSNEEGDNDDVNVDDGNDDDGNDDDANDDEANDDDANDDDANDDDANDDVNNNGNDDDDGNDADEDDNNDTDDVEMSCRTSMVQVESRNDTFSKTVAFAPTLTSWRDDCRPGCCISEECPSYTESYSTSSGNYLDGASSINTVENEERIAGLFKQLDRERDNMSHYNEKRKMNERIIDNKLNKLQNKKNKLLVKINSIDK